MNIDMIILLLFTVYQQEAALCPQFHPRPALRHVHPESFGRVHQGCRPVLQRRHQPLHPLHGETLPQLLVANGGIQEPSMHRIVLPLLLVLTCLRSAALHCFRCLLSHIDTPSFSLPVSLPHQFACKASVVFCHYCAMANFFWLLVEALYLNSLLLSSFYQCRRCLLGFGLLGWGEKSSAYNFPHFFSCIDWQLRVVVIYFSKWAWCILIQQ